MKSEYDFSKATRSQFYRRDAELQSPIYLDASVREALAARAREQGVEVSELANEMLQQQIAQKRPAK